ncbi:MAG: helix-turn-helix transcriptional regulator [Gammaproteobacteria bacterium]|nr:helix-turn-helix transcriptional regulator [Woeseia sp.]MBU2678178.1 helix-turn-helix transcriptional regulator [Gammaproteobacteria bacterium]NNL51913.1 helix-turn-helix transcriptional regulator [Woeseiaceae bacterium]
MDFLSNKIRELRFRHGEMTQKTLAERVGVSRQTMNAIENCRHAPTVAVAIRIADVFHVSVDQLFDLDYNGKPARREQTAKLAIDRSQATIEEPIEIDDRFEPVAKQAGHQTSLADLRKVIGS